VVLSKGQHGQQGPVMIATEMNSAIRPMESDLPRQRDGGKNGEHIFHQSS